MMMGFGFLSTLNMLIWTYYWEFDAQSVSVILSVPSLLAVALMAVTLGHLGRRFEKYHLLQFAFLGMILNCLRLYPMRYLGWLPENGTPVIFWLNFIFMAVFMYCFLMRTIQNQSIIADVSDEHDMTHGLRQEAGFFAANNFANKSATVFGPFYGGVVLDMIGLTSSMRPGEIGADVLDRLVIAYGLGALPFMGLGLFFSMRITLSRARVESLQRAIRERDASAARGL